MLAAPVCKTVGARSRFAGTAATSVSRQADRTALPAHTRARTLIHRAEDGAVAQVVPVGGAQGAEGQRAKEG